MTAAHQALVPLQNDSSDRSPGSKSWFAVQFAKAGPWAVLAFFLLLGFSSVGGFLAYEMDWLVKKAGEAITSYVSQSTQDLRSINARIDSNVEAIRDTDKRLAGLVDVMVKHQESTAEAVTVMQRNTDRLDEAFQLMRPAVVEREKQTKILEGILKSVAVPQPAAPPRSG